MLNKLNELLLKTQQTDNLDAFIDKFNEVIAEQEKENLIYFVNNLVKLIKYEIEKENKDYDIFINTFNALMRNEKPDININFIIGLWTNY